jgi:2-hydroxychromene-2-carboxylate isomerase
LTVPVKARYVNMDYQRYAKPYGVPLIINPHFPIVTLHLMRVATGVQLRAAERFQKFLAATRRCARGRDSSRTPYIDGLDAHDAQTRPLACGRKDKGNSVP